MAVYATNNVLSLGFYKSLIGGLVYSTLRRTCLQNPVLIMLRLSAILINFEKRFIEVFDETKPFIKLSVRHSICDVKVTWYTHTGIKASKVIDGTRPIRGNFYN